MSSLALPLLISAALILSAVLMPTLLRRAEPILVRVPRLAVGFHLGAAALWLLSFAAVSLALAWVLNGPQLLPTAYGRVCRACLEAASPFSVGVGLTTPLPVAVLVAAPAALLVVFLLLGMLRVVHHRRAVSCEYEAVRGAGRETSVLGHRVLMLPVQAPVAFSLPRGRGGIVVSEGLLAALDPPELAAVLAHEQTHLRQRHHLIMVLLSAFAAPLRTVPLFGTVVDAVPRYLEIAADAWARGLCGTPALAAALLRIGEHRHRPAAQIPVGSPAPLLHAAGPDRIAHLVAPPTMRTAWTPMITLLGLAVTLALSALLVYSPYVLALLRGCGVPV
ncbi:MAG TPA: M56 family metallopeptidase [Actinomycetaceae bacterium]|nr:M56 family metallopeptidase [Actinomycetaceae bacterium]